MLLDPDENVPDLVSDEEIPDLVTNPDLTYEDKEAQEQNADEDFDIDTEVAIQQSLGLNTILKMNQANTTYHMYPNHNHLR